MNRKWSCQILCWSHLFSVCVFGVILLFTYFLLLLLFSYNYGNHFPSANQKLVSVPISYCNTFFFSIGQIFVSSKSVYTGADEKHVKMLRWPLTNTKHEGDSYATWTRAKSRERRRQRQRGINIYVYKYAHTQKHRQTHRDIYIYIYIYIYPTDFFLLIAF